MTVELTFAEALTAQGVVRDYVRLRREHDMAEDALIGYLYAKLETAIKDAEALDHDAYARAYALVILPAHLPGEEEPDGPEEDA